MRNEYPRPQFERKNWLNLNGEWEFELDPEAIGMSEKWYLHPEKLTKKIKVPFVYQSDLSGVEDKSASETVWYSRQFELEQVTPTTILHFGAVDYQTNVYVNEALVGQHIGGHTNFKLIFRTMFDKGKTRLLYQFLIP